MKSAVLFLLTIIVAQVPTGCGGVSGGSEQGFTVATENSLIETHSQNRRLADRAAFSCEGDSKPRISQYPEATTPAKILETAESTCEKEGRLLLAIRFFYSQKPATNTQGMLPKAELKTLIIHPYKQLVHFSLSNSMGECLKFKDVSSGNYILPRKQISTSEPFFGSLNCEGNFFDGRPSAGFLEVNSLIPVAFFETPLVAGKDYALCNTNDECSTAIRAEERPAKQFPAVLESLTIDSSDQFVEFRLSESAGACLKFKDKSSGSDILLNQEPTPLLPFTDSFHCVGNYLSGYPAKENEKVIKRIPLSDLSVALIAGKEYALCTSDNLCSSYLPATKVKAKTATEQTFQAH